MEELNVAQIQHWTKEELILEVALLKVRIKSSSNYRQVQYRREMIKTINHMIANMETAEEKACNELALENAYLLAKQDTLKKRRINRHTILRK